LYSPRIAQGFVEGNLPNPPRRYQHPSAPPLTPTSGGQLPASVPDSPSLLHTTLHTLTTYLRNIHDSTTRSAITARFRQTHYPRSRRNHHSISRRLHSALSLRPIPACATLDSLTDRLPNPSPSAIPKAVLTTTLRHTQPSLYHTQPILRHTQPTPHHPTRLNALSQRHLDSRPRLHPRHNSTHRSRFTPLHHQHSKEEEKE